MQGITFSCKSYSASYSAGTYFTNPGHSCHPAVAVGRRLLLARLGEEEVDLVIIAGAAAQAFPHQGRTHKVGLCMGEENSTQSFCAIFFLSDK